MSSPHALAPGTRLGPYVLGAPLGRGSTATVYVGTRGNRQVAVKVRGRGDAELDRRFLREFEALRGLSVPGVVRVFDAGIGERWLWYAMELVRGEPIRNWIEAGGDPAGRSRRLLAVAPALCDALAGIHRAGLIHRDLKPSNVLVDPQGAPHVLDFGVVRFWAEGDALTGEGGLVGTLPFMAPEQVAGAPLTAKADVFSLGLVLYEGVAGRRPRPTRAQDWLRIQCLDRPRPLATLDPAVPRPLSAVVERMTALDPRDRPDARECATLFRACAAGGGPTEWPEPGAFVGEPPALRTALGMIHDRGPRFLVLAGPAGSGRRRTAEQIRRRAMLAGMRTARGRCRIERPGGAIGEIVEELFEAPAEDAWREGLAGPDAGALLEMWPDLPLYPAEAGPAASARDVVMATVATLGRATGENGLLLLVEDLDEVDRVTARALEAIAIVAPPKLRVIVTMDDRFGGRRAKRLVATLVDRGAAAFGALPDLTGDEARALAQSLVPEGTPVVADAGSPMAARDAGIAALARLRRERVPTVPTAAYPAALDPRPLALPVWEALGVDPQQLCGAGVLRQAGPESYALRDGAARQRALARLPARPLAAKRLADALAHDTSPDRHGPLARARLLADDAPGAFEPAALAAIEAERRGRYREAREWLVLLDALPRDRAGAAYQRLRFPLARCRAAVAARTGSDRPRADLLGLAVQRAETRIDRIEVALLHAEHLRRAGDVRAALVACMKQAGRPVSDELSARVAVAALLQAAEIRLELGQHADARAHLDRAESLRGGRHGDIDQVLLDHLRAEVALAGGDLDGCVELCRRGIRLATALGADRGLARLHLSHGHALFYLGDRVAAEEAGATARRLQVASGERAAAAETAVHLGGLALGRGDPATAALHVREALTTARRLNLVRLRARALALSLEVATVRRDPEAARRVLAEVDTLPARETPLAVAELRWWRSVGEYDRALLAADPGATTGYRGAEMELETARLRIVCGDTHKAFAHLERAEALAKAGGFRELLLYARVLRGAAEPDVDDGWAATVEEALRSPWIDLFLYVLLVDARRRHVQGDALGARGRYLELAVRAEEHGHRPFSAAAQAALGD
ncbi:MAG: protein kinase domain-containing protein [Myxococcota bacterium]